MFFKRFDRLLFLLRPPAPVAQHIDRERRILRLGKPVLTDYLHITLYMLDFPILPGWAVPHLRAMGDSIAFPPFRVAVDRMTGSPGSVLLRPSERIEALFALQAQLAAAMARVHRLRGHAYRFRPHVTLAHRRGGDSFEWEIDPISWRAEELLLVHSKVGLTEHVVLDRWPLAIAPSGQGRQRPVDRLLPMALQKGVGLGERPAAEEAVMR